MPYRHPLTDRDAEPVTNEDLDRRLARVESKLDEMMPLLQVWNTAVGGSKFVKWFAGLLAAVIAAWVAVKSLIH